MYEAQKEEVEGMLDGKFGAFKSDRTGVVKVAIVIWKWMHLIKEEATVVQDQEGAVPDSKERVPIAAACWSKKWSSDSGGVGQNKDKGKG